MLTGHKRLAQGIALLGVCVLVLAAGVSAQSVSAKGMPTPRR